MFVGHYGVSFAAKALDPALPLPALMVSTQILDIAWSGLILAGIEKVRLKRHFTATNDLDLYFMPFSHGLPGALAWSALAGGIVYALPPGQEIVSAAIVAAVCFSHWLLDLIVHVPDLPLIANRRKVGFGLWNNRNAALALELAVLFGGAAAYMASLGSASTGMWWFMLAFSLLLGVLHLYSLFGPPPKSPTAMAGSALAAYLAVALITLAAAYYLE